MRRSCSSVAAHVVEVFGVMSERTRMPVVSTRTSRVSERVPQLEERWKRCSTGKGFSVVDGSGFSVVLAKVAAGVDPVEGGAAGMLDTGSFDVVVASPSSGRSCSVTVVRVVASGPLPERPLPDPEPASVVPGEPDPDPDDPDPDDPDPDDPDPDDPDPEDPDDPDPEPEFDETTTAAVVALPPDDPFDAWTGVAQHENPTIAAMTMATARRWHAPIVMACPGCSARTSAPPGSGCRLRSSGRSRSGAP